MTIEVDNTEGTPEENDPTSLTEDLNQALFDTGDINSSDWEPPRLKTPENVNLCPVNDCMVLLLLES